MDDTFDGKRNVFDIKKNMRLIFKLFKWFGLNPPKKSSKYYWFYNILSLSQYFHNMIIILLLQCIYLYVVRKDLEEVSKTVYLTACALGNTLKVFFFRLALNKFKTLMYLLDQPEFQPKCQRQINKIDGKLTTFITVHKIAMVLSVMFGVMYVISPIISRDRILPVKLWLPYDYESTPIFELSFVMQFYAICYNSFNSLNLDCFAAGMMLLIDVQLICLRDSLENLHEDLLEDSKKNGVISMKDFNWYKNKALGKLIDHHKRIVRFVTEVQSVYGIIVFIQFTAFTISLCTTMFLMSMEKPFSGQFFTFLVYQAVLMTQLYTYNYYGNEVIVDSEQLLTACFQMNWIDSDLTFKKSLVIFMIRLQKPIRIYFGGIFLISLASFMSMVKSSASYFTFLRKMHGDA